MSKSILTIADRVMAKQYIGWPCVFSDEYYLLYNLNMKYVTVGRLKDVEDNKEFPFCSFESNYRYYLPIGRGCLSEIEKLERQFNIQQLYAAIKYKVEVTNVQE